MKGSWKNGFTLVELLVVMAIMSILAIISFGQFQGAQAKARDVERKSNVSTISKSLGFYLSDYNDLPDQGYFNSVLFGGGQFDDTIKGGKFVYLPKVPTERTSDMPKYCFIKKDKSFVVLAGLENMKDTDCHTVTINILNSGLPPSCSGKYRFALSSPDVTVENFIINVLKSPGVSYNSSCL